MRPVVAAIIAAVRQALPSIDAGSPLMALDDTALAHVVFFNYREHLKFGHGMRLSPEGLALLTSCFRHYEVEIERDFGSLELLYLNRASSLPYYLQRDHIVLFDATMAVHLRLTGGSLKRLRESAEFWSPPM